MAANSAKRSFSELVATKMRCPKEILYEDGPVKKKLKKNLVDIFNRASMCVNASEDHMSVFLRIKPFTSFDASEENQGCLRVNQTDQSVVAVAPELSQTNKNLSRGLGKSEHEFTFSRIFNEDTSQAEFFNQTMLGMTKEFISGQNSLIFTYGVTSSGKTYTIQGKPLDAGILPRSLDVLFNSISGKQIEGIKFKPLRFTDVVKLSPEEEMAELKIKDKTLKMSSDDDNTVATLLGDETDGALSCTMASCSSTSQDDFLLDIETRVREELKVDVDDCGKFKFSVWISFAEIYNEQTFDLLERISSKRTCRRTMLKIADDQNGSPYIKGLKEISVESADEAYRLLTIGQKNLQTASTRLNHCSSRSHCIFTIKVIRVVDKDDPNIASISMLSFCDLAGSERYSKTQSTGDRLKEAGNINTSLLTLGRCIDVLRFNQLHRESQKIVPFRESKLTRLFQNFFNGNGRAAMIVNVSQCASMFDETLQVFKFSAIAKQVKYVKKPPETPKPKKKIAPISIPRSSIAWEGTGSDSKSLEYPSDIEESEEDDTDLDHVLCKKSQKELVEIIKSIKEKNAKLLEALEEEMINAGNTEIRVRREVCNTMKKQQVVIEKEYSKLLEEAEEDAREAMDKRVQSVVEIYEAKLKRLQHKVDDDDEWVSSLLFYREQQKVQERDERLAELEKILEERGMGNDSQDKVKDEKIECLEDEIAELKSQHYSSEKEKEEKLQEMESYLQEASDAYEDSMAKIAKLNEVAAEFALETKAQEDKLGKMHTEKEELQDLNDQHLKEIELLKIELEESTKEHECKEEKLGKLQTEKQQLQDLNDQHMKEIDLLKKELEDHESKEDHDIMLTERQKLQDLNDQHIKEIERLTDELESITKEHESKEEELGRMQSEKQQLQDLNDQHVKKIDQLKYDLEANTTGLEHEEEKHSKMQAEQLQLQDLNGQHMKEIDQLKNELEASTREQECEEEKLCQMQAEKQQLQDLIDQHMKKIDKLENELEASTKELECKEEKLCKMQTEKQQLQHLNDQHVKEIDHIKNELEASAKEHECKVEELNSSAIKKTEEECLQLQAQSPVITHMVKELEKKLAPSSDWETCEEWMDDDDEIVFNHNPVPVSKCASADVAASHRKEAELTINVLRNKLRKEEEDFFKREQALIHGYTAEIDNLKMELVRLKCKTQTSQGKKQSSSLDCHISEDEGSIRPVKNFDHKFCQTTEAEGCIQDEEKCEHKLSQAVLMGELTSLREQLLSSKEAYHQLQCQDQSSQTHSLSPKQVEVSPVSRQSIQGVLYRESNLTDSVLNFEMTEYAVELDMWKSKVEQLSQEIAGKEKMLQEAECSNNDLCGQLKSMTDEIDSLQSDVEEEKSKSLRFEEEIKNLTEKVEELHSLMNEKDTQLEEMRSKLNASQFSEAGLKEKMDELRDEIQSLQSDVEARDNDIEEVETELKQTTSLNSDLEKEIASLEERLKSQLDDRTALTLMKNSVEKMKEDHQQESAEVSQKLVLLEKEKRIAERKLTEMKGKEQEWQMKYQAQEKMNELEQQLQNQLRTNTEHLKKQSMIVSEQLEKLNQQQTELTTLNEEKAQLKEELSSLQSTCSVLRVEAEVAKKKIEELLIAMTDLKKGLQDSDSMTERQEEVISSQDDEISNLNAKLDDVTYEKEELTKKLLQREQEATTLSLTVKEEICQERSTMEEKLQKADSEKCDLKAKLKKMEKEYETLQEELETRVSKSRKERRELDDLQHEINVCRSDAEKLKDNAKSMEWELEKVKAKLLEEEKEKCRLKNEIDLSKTKQDKESSSSSSRLKELEKENLELKEDISKYTNQLKVKSKDVEDLRLQLDSVKQNLKQHEKDLAKQESINRRNREEMEIWKQEEDTRVATYEDALERAVQEKKVLEHENEKLKKDNSDLVKEVTNSSCAKDKVIADLRKNNNTLSIELASVEGISPPPKMDTPDKRIDFVEDIDTTGHLEMDVTPQAALKKSRKRHGSNKILSTGLSEMENFTPTRKSLKTIEETNEQSPCTSKDERKPHPPPGIASDLANEIFSSLSPMTRSGKGQSKGKQKKHPPPSRPTSADMQDENELPLSTRRSSRLQTRSSSKQSII